MGPLVMLLLLNLKPACMDCRCSSALNFYWFLFDSQNSLPHILSININTKVIETCGWHDFDDQIIKNGDLEELRELGSGTFGTVYYGKWRGTDVAIKRIKKSCFAGRSSEQEKLVSSVFINLLSHLNIWLLHHLCKKFHWHQTWKHWR